MYSHRSSTGPVDLAFTDRYGGVSAVPFDSLNLALVGEDDAVSTARNVALLLEDFAPGAELADMEQVHGATVLTAGGPRGRCDALVSDRAEVVLMVRGKGGACRVIDRRGRYVTTSCKAASCAAPGSTRSAGADAGEACAASS